MQIIINGDSFTLCSVPIFNGKKKKEKKVARQKQKQIHVGGFKLFSAYHPASRLLRQHPIESRGAGLVGAVFVGRRWNTYETIAHLGVPAAPILITPLPWYWLMETLSGLLGGGQAQSMPSRREGQETLMSRMKDERLTIKPITH